MKRARILLIIFLLPLLGGLSRAGETRDTVRVLAIGNSFSQDAVEQNLFEIARADGRVLIIGNMYIGGCSLERHVKNLRENRPDYAYRKIGTDGVRREQKGTTLETALADEKWDYVSLQQASPLSGLFESYVEWLPELCDYVRERVSPDTRIIIHQTWAYSADSDHKGFENYDRDQMKMFRAIIDAYNRAAELIGVTVIVPSGTAIQNARTSFIGDGMNRDGFHLNLTYGRFTAACTWYERLFGGICRNSYVPEGMTKDYVKVAHKSARQAVRHPDRVTKIRVRRIR